ncbi:MAG: hypothetical protein ACFFD4_15355 [Candidatus Odinarchaeota archaeon]
MRAKKRNFFAKEFNELEYFLFTRKDDLDDGVIEILTTFVELLDLYSDAVNGFNSYGFNTELQDFMAEKAELFYRKFEPYYSEKDAGSRICLKRDVVYIYEFSSITINIKSSWSILYPFSLLTGANYWNFIPDLCRKLTKKEGKITLLDFIEEFFDLQRKGTPKLCKRDIELLKKMTSEPLGSREELERFKKRNKSKRHWRLTSLGVWGCPYRINFPAIGLVPYFHLSKNDIVDIPSEMEKYIESEHKLGKQHRGFLFRLFLLPADKENVLADELTKLGPTGRIAEIYHSHNWDAFERSARGKLRWNIDFSPLESGNISLPQERHVYNLLVNKDKQGMSPGLVTLLNEIHGQTGLVHPKNLVSRTGLSLNTVREYIRRSLDQQIILPYLSFSKIGLDTFYAVIFENKPVNQYMTNFFDSLPRVKVMKTDRFSRYLLFLPETRVKKLDRLLKNLEERKEIEMLVRCEINTRDVIKEGTVDLYQLWESGEI